MDSAIITLAKQYIERSREAQRQLVPMTQAEVDAIAYACGKTVYNHAELLARQAVEETGLGNLKDKILKKKAKAEATWTEIRDKKTVGIIKRDFDKRMIYYADPVGVIAGVAPCTNPVATAMFYAMICLKTRNTLILSPHPKAIKTTHLTFKLIREAIAFAGLSDDCLLVIDEPNLSGKEVLALASEIMSRADLVIATGGAKLVDVAYHSGTPAYGVGAGNTPVYIHESAPIAAALEKVVTGRAFDNGIICASEQHLIVPQTIYSQLVAAIPQASAYYVGSPAEKLRLSQLIFDEAGHLKAEFVGQSAAYIAERCEIPQAASIKALIVPIRTEDIGQDPFSAEKLCPILSILTVDNHDEAIQTAEALLNYQGRGHSAAIHIDEKNYEADLLSYSSAMPATHIIVNQASATSSGGSKFNWLTPSTTLGCGAYGGTMPMETINLTVKQLINYKAVAMPLAESRIPEGTFAL